MMFVVFDLDGTLALNEHRQHFVQRPVGKKDWDAFFEACDEDEPNWPVIETLKCFVRDGKRVEIWSGRKDSVVGKTRRWLYSHGLGEVYLKMRPEGDTRPDTVLKKEWLDTSHKRPNMVFDDRNSVVKMWRENGIVCCQVAEGDF